MKKKLFSIILLITVSNIYCESKRIYCKTLGTANILKTLDQQITSKNDLIGNYQIEIDNFKANRNYLGVANRIRLAAGELNNRDNLKYAAYLLYSTSCKSEYDPNFTSSFTVDNWPF